MSCIQIFIHYWVVLQNKYGAVHIRAAEFYWDFLSQTPSLSLNQTMTPSQFSGPYDIVLPQPESLLVGHFKANIEMK